MKKLLLILILASAILISGCSLNNKACTLEAKICPDGSTVGRNVNNNCEFDPCPATNEFNVYYSFGVGEKNILDTKNNLYIKDMICDPIKKYEIKLSDNEKNQIYNMIIENDLLNIKDDFTENCNLLGICQDITPLSGSTLQIEYDGKTKNIKWRANYYNENNSDLKKFMNVQKVILDIISKKEKEINIEQPKCGYL